MSWVEATLVAAAVVAAAFVVDRARRPARYPRLQDTAFLARALAVAALLTALATTVAALSGTEQAAQLALGLGLLGCFLLLYLLSRARYGRRAAEPVGSPGAEAPAARGQTPARRRKRRRKRRGPTSRR